jgi:hypothetical protein
MFLINDIHIIIVERIEHIERIEKVNHSPRPSPAAIEKLVLCHFLREWARCHRTKSRIEMKKMGEERARKISQTGRKIWIIAVPGAPARLPAAVQKG